MSRWHYEHTVAEPLCECLTWRCAVQTCRAFWVGDAQCGAGGHRFMSCMHASGRTATASESSKRRSTATNGTATVTASWFVRSAVSHGVSAVAWRGCISADSRSCNLNHVACCMLCNVEHSMWTARTRAHRWLVWSSKAPSHRFCESHTRICRSAWC